MMQKAGSDMNDFFSDIPGISLEWFGPAHLALTLGFVLSVVLFWHLFPKLKATKAEPIVRYAILALGVLFEWRVFESRLLTTSVFRLPLCAVALYTLFYAVAFKKEKVFKVAYFYAFGSLLSFLFFDTPFGLDRWSGWTFFGAHAVIAWLAGYGVRVMGYVPGKRDFVASSLVLAGYAFLWGYAFLRFGGADELFLFTPPVDFLTTLQHNSPVLYLALFSLFAAALMVLMALSVRAFRKETSVR
jgi:uncharacterized membrane protein YwaF